MKAARSAAQLRAAQAVLLPLELGLTLEQTARAIGRSIGATCRMRTTFCAVADGSPEARTGKDKSSQPCQSHTGAGGGRP